MENNTQGVPCNAAHPALAEAMAALAARVRQIAPPTSETDALLAEIEAFGNDSDPLEAAGWFEAASNNSADWATDGECDEELCEQQEAFLAALVWFDEKGHPCDE